MKQILSIIIACILISQNLYADEITSKVTEADRQEFFSVMAAIERAEKIEAELQKKELEQLKVEIEALREGLIAFSSENRGRKDQAEIARMRQSIKGSAGNILKEEKLLTNKKHMTPDHKQKLRQKLQQITSEVVDEIDKNYNEEKIQLLIDRLEIKNSGVIAGSSVDAPEYKLPIVESEGHNP